MGDCLIICYNCFLLKCDHGGCYGLYDGVSFGGPVQAAFIYVFLAVMGIMVVRVDYDFLVSPFVFSSF